MTAWSDFIENPSAERVYLVQLGIAHDNGSSVDTKTLYLGTHPKEFAHYYHPCIKGVPRFSRLLQDIFTKQSMPSWGNLVLLREDNYDLTPDGLVDFDDLVSGNWECAGRDIEILFGGDNLAEGDYQTIMKGVVDKVESWDDGKIEISIMDIQEKLRKKIIAKNKIMQMETPESWALLDENCSVLTDWANLDQGTGESEVSPAGQFRFDSNASAANDDFASRSQDIGEFLNTFTVEIKTYHDLVGTQADDDAFRMLCYQLDEALGVMFASDGLFIHDTDSGNTEVGVNLVKTGGAAEWQTWRFVVTFAASTGDGTCDVYLDDSTHTWEKVGTGINCSYEGAGTNGLITLTQRGFITDNMVTHVDYIKAVTGLYSSAYPDAAESILGKRKPFAIGDCRNIKPVLIDKTLRKYLVHDTDIAVHEGVSTVYAKGDSVAFTEQLADGTFTLNAPHDGTITCDEKGFKYDGSYVEHIGSVAKGLLIICGDIVVGDITAGDITTINAAFPYDLGTYVTGDNNVLDVLDKLAEGLPLWYGFSREAKFEIKEFGAMSPDEPPAYFNMRSIQSGLKCSSSGEVTYKVIIKYDKNPTKMSANAIAVTVTDDYKAWLEEQWREEEVHDLDILDLYELAEEKELETALRDRVDAAIIADDWLTLLKSKRFEVVFTVKSPALACHLGDTVSITYDRFGLESGVLHIVTAIEENYDRNEYMITGWR